MPVRILYPLRKQANRRALVMMALSGAVLAGCGPINPNIQTIIQRDAGNYTIEGAVTMGFAARAKVGYVMGEGDNPDQGSFRNRGPSSAGITTQGVYIPSGLLSLDSNRRFRHNFESTKRFVLIKVFAWNDLNGDGVRDANEQLAGEYQLRKEDLRGWSYNAPDWNQFNFVFTR